MNTEDMMKVKKSLLSADTNEEHISLNAERNTESDLYTMTCLLFWSPVYRYLA